MQEDFIHYLWKFKKLSGQQLQTTEGKSVVIKSLGTHNFHSGPDFFNGRLEIDGQEWAGNIEMHVKASDWYLHGHDDDPAYDNVILHVVWIHDAEISRRDEVNIPVLEVSKYVPKALVKSYQKLFAVKNNQFINCENDFATVDDFKKVQWFEKLFFERLEQRSIHINRILKQTHNDWEALFFQVLCRSFGTKINGDAFEQLAQSIDSSTVRKLAKDAFQLEATLLGQAGLLNDIKEDRYYKLLVDEYAFAKAKFQLQPALIPMKFFRLRPANYPTIRISQLAMLYHRTPHLFGEVLLTKSRTEIHKLFEVKAASYWDMHHVFDKETKSREKTLTPSFIDLVIINCIVPIKFAHAQFTGRDKTEELLELMYDLKPESNTVVDEFKKLTKITNGLESQAVLQLKPQYCDTNKCLSCDIGVSLIRYV
ncbi:hypothetical protein BST92_08335 [Nonlabens arenilitoris]|uniref:DUF2851 domain-containing protein n=1 Tax=Nonlabens arenilitoris TaxID=1217969 RepID=A0A2S7UCF9_9FLAO|nr:DUF2851 family protein [Nonlabens arenilitoris]PQJ31932.1 hypothetical protein BST92_08335 [Nonlabens arenilitoris]